MARPIITPEEFKREAVELLQAERVAAGAERACSRRLDRVAAALAQAGGDRRRRARGPEDRGARGAAAPPSPDRVTLAESRGLLRKGERDPVTVFRSIEAERASFPISLCGRMLGVSRLGFHAWRGHVPRSARSTTPGWSSGSAPSTSAAAAPTARRASTPSSATRASASAESGSSS